MKNNKVVLLLSTMLKSTSSINTLKYSKDKKKRGQVIGGFIGYGILYLCLFTYFILQAYIVCKLGMSRSVPSLCAMALSAVSFLFTLLKSNGYLYNFKEYDMIMSMPFEIKTVVSSKFMYMFIKSLGFPMAISVSMLIGYGIYEKPAFYVYILWIVLSVATLLIPTAVASLLSSCVAGIGSIGKRAGRVIQTVLIFVFVVFVFCLRFIIEAVVRNGEGEAIFTQISKASDSAKVYYLPAIWFEEAIVDLKPLSILLLLATSAVIFVFFFIFVSKSYKKVNTKLSSHAANRGKKKLVFKKRSIARSIANKEIKRFFGSVAYMTNAGMGQVMVIIVGVVALFLDAETLTKSILHDAPIGIENVMPAIPFLVYLFIGMVSTAAITPSLEGKNYWILQSMPVKKEDICRGKMLFNLYASIPFAVFGVSALCICFKTGVIRWLVYVLCEVMMCLFSTTYGMFCGMKFMKLEWENEIEVIKQGSAVTFYLFPNVIISLIGLVGIAALSFIISDMLVVAAVSVIFAICSFIFYKITLKLR